MPLQRRIREAIVVETIASPFDNIEPKYEQNYGDSLASQVLIYYDLHCANIFNNKS